MTIKKVSYLKGLAEGYGLTGEESKLEKIVLEMLDCMEDMANEVDFLNSDFQSLENYVEMLDDDLAELEMMFEDDDDYYFDEDDDWDDLNWNEEDKESDLSLIHI